MSEHLQILNMELHRLHELLKIILQIPDSQDSFYKKDLYNLLISDIKYFQSLIANYQLKPNPLLTNVIPIK